MVKVREILQTEKNEIDEIVNIHLNTFQGFFLTFLGKGFLRQMYNSYCTYNRSGVLAAYEDSGRIVGFLAYSEDLSGLYQYMLKKRLLFFAWYSLGAFVRNPKVLMRLLGAFFKPGESKRDEAYVMISSIGVRPEVKGIGVGTQLMDALKERVDLQKYAYIMLETDAVDNDAANYFYQKNGFVLNRTFFTRESRQMNEYRFGERK